MPEDASGAPPVILERYRLVRTLGAGGMGTVYEAEHVHLGSHHAIKALQIRGGGTMTDEQQKEIELRFLREAKICASVRHPNLVNVSDFGSDDGMPFIVMDFIDGQDLQQLVEAQGALAPELSLRIIRDTAAALGALHDKGIIHRDMKPANIMIERDTGRVLLTDLGIAKDTQSDANLTQGILGTPAYMAPEQMTDTSKTSTESDVYSLGVVMYAALTGKEPFTGDNPFAVLQQAREKLFAFGSMAGVAEKRDKITLPEGLKALLHDMTHYERTKRISSCNEVVSRCNQIIGQLNPNSAEGYSGVTMAAPVGIPAENTGPDTAGTLVQAAPPPQTTAQPQPAEPETGAVTNPDTSRLYAALSGAEEEGGGGGGSKGVVAVVMLLILAGLGGGGYYGFKQGWFAPKSGDTPVTTAENGDASTTTTNNGASANNAANNNTDTTPKEPVKPVRKFDIKKVPDMIEIKLADKFSIELCLVRPGKFKIGDTEQGTHGENERHYLNEQPARTITLTKAYFIGRYEVTIDDFAEYLNLANGSGAPSEEKLASAGLMLEDGVYQALPGRGKRPMSFVSHQAARRFCKWASRSTGLSFDLPSEVEWEYAARGPKSPVYPWGDEFDDMNCAAGLHRLSDVGKYPGGASWCGAQDMAGNAFEWTSDLYQHTRYENIKTTNPPVESPGSSARERVVRGGMYSSDGYQCRTSYRNAITGFGEIEGLGFRVKLNATPELNDYLDKQNNKDEDKDDKDATDKDATSKDAASEENKKTE